MKNKILFLLFFLLSSNLIAQRFSAGIVGGMNTSELDALGLDSYTGLNVKS